MEMSSSSPAMNRAILSDTHTLQCTGDKSELESYSWAQSRLQMRRPETIGVSDIVGVLPSVRSLLLQFGELVFKKIPLTESDSFSFDQHHRCWSVELCWAAGVTAEMSQATWSISLLGILDKFYSLVGEDKTHGSNLTQKSWFKQICKIVPLVLRMNYKVTRI